MLELLLNFFFQAEKNEDYSKNLQKLEKLVLVLFQNDSMVIPRESAWFGFYAPGQADKVLSFEETDLFTQVRSSIFFLLL